MIDEIRLVIPSEEDFRPIARLVAGGLALTLDLTYDHLEDLQVAIDALLALRDDSDDVVVELAVGERVLHATVGPFVPETLYRLDEDGDEDDAELGLRRVLETVCDGFELEERDDGTWVELTKRTAAEGTV